MFHGVAIARVVIAIRFPNGCNSMFLLPWFFGVVMIFSGVAIVRYFCNSKWTQYHVTVATVFVLL